MIKSLHIENFQSHDNTHVELTAGVNVFVGSSDAGKSAILRALNWVATNRPAGDAVRSTWGGDTVVTVVTNDDGAIERMRTTKKNEYRIFPEDAQAESLTLKAIGQDVPAEVQAALRLEDVNIQYQMDSPFLLSRDWSPGRVAEYLNEVAGLDAIDRAEATANAKTKKARAEAEAATRELNEDRKAVIALAYVDDFDAGVRVLEEAMALATKARVAEQRLYLAVADVTAAEQALANAPDYTHVEQIIKNLDMAAADATALCRRIDNLTYAAAAIASAHVALDNIESVVAAEPALGLIAGNREAGISARLHYDELVAVVVNVEALQRRVDALTPQLRAARVLSYTEAAVADYNRVDASCGQLEALLAGVHESVEIGEYVTKKFIGLEQEYERIAPAVCPMCAGTGRLK